MDKSFRTWADYWALMACHLVVLDKIPGVLPVGIGETLKRALADGDQANTACGNMQLCAGLKVGIEGTTQAVGKRRREREVQRRREEEAGIL